MRVKITSHSVGWLEEDVQNWLSSRVAENAPLLLK
jgi:predicted DNA-binding transcriptional regulator AlpA